MLTTENTTPRGTGKMAAVRITFHTLAHIHTYILAYMHTREMWNRYKPHQSLPFSCLYRRPVTMPPHSPHTAYMRITAVKRAPLSVHTITHIHAYIHTKPNPYLLVALKAPTITETSRKKTVKKICAPDPIRAANRLARGGHRNTSP